MIKPLKFMAGVFGACICLSLWAPACAGPGGNLPVSASVESPRMDIDPPAPPVSSPLADFLERVTSPEEAERHRAIANAGDMATAIAPADLIALIGADRSHNVSALIYVMMKAKNPALYRLDPPAQSALAVSDGAFPNIAWYYARILPEKGVARLMRLYDEHPSRRMFICRALGEAARSGADGAHVFLKKRAMAEEAGNHKAADGALAPLAGLAVAGRPVDSRWIRDLLTHPLGREESILLAELEAEWTDDELMDLYRAGGARSAYAVEHVLGRPVRRLTALERMVDWEMRNGDPQLVRQWMLSDSMRNARHEAVKALRDRVLTED